MVSYHTVFLIPLSGPLWDVFYESLEWANTFCSQPENIFDVYVAYWLWAQIIKQTILLAASIVLFGTASVLKRVLGRLTKDRPVVP